MVFSSLPFLSLFLPAVFLLHLAARGIGMKNAVLLIAGLLFYAYGEPVYLWLMIGSSLFNYLAARWIDREAGTTRKRGLIFAVAGNLLLLFVFKYLALFAPLSARLGITLPVLRLPIGISFFTFQAMSYVIDVFRGGQKAEKNFGKVLLYISFFPQLIAGPIVLYRDIAQQIDCRQVTASGVKHGLRRFSCGLCKKVLIANTMGAAADAMFAVDPVRLGAAGAWLGALSYLFQIYFDFSGYSDMAIGMGAMFGFSIRENFHYPYVALGLRDFWRRWHISLTGWFRDYLYIPLGGNRGGRRRTIRNRMIVFACTGIWHGANLTFLVWGLYHWALMTLEEAVGRRKRKVPRLLIHGYTLLAVTVGFVIFRADTLQQGLAYLAAMAVPWRPAPAGNVLALAQMTPLYLVTLGAAAVCSLPVREWSRNLRQRCQAIWEGAEDFLSLLGLVLCVLSLAGGNYNPFIYFRF